MSSASGSGGPSPGRKAAKKSAGKKAAKKSGAKKVASSGSAARKRAAKKAGKASARKRADFSGKTVAEFRQALSSNLIRPLEMVMLSRNRIEDALDEVVRRGRMTRDDATQLGQALYTLGRQQTEDVLRDLEQLLGRGRSSLDDSRVRARERSADAVSAARKQAEQAANAARKAADPLLAQADRARRVAGVGPTFPITGYDDLTAAQIQSRLDTLTPAELRKVRDYERRRGNRTTVLEAIEAKL